MKKIISFLVLLILFSSLAYGRFNFYSKDLEAYFLDIGQGDAILIRTPEGKNILVDGGPDNLLLYRLAEVLPWWERTIDYLVISHYHADHMLGFIELLNKYKVKNVLVGPQQAEDDLLFNLWQEKLAEKKIVPQIVKVGDQFVLNDLSWKIFSADGDHEDYNDNSVVFKLSYRDFDLLLTGDLTSLKEEDLLNSDFDLSAEVLKVAHHGSKYSSGLNFLEKVAPEICLIQSETGNSFGHPHQELLERLEMINCQVLRNDALGTIKIRTDGYSWQIN